MNPERVVAVVAQDSESWRKEIVDDPRGKVRSVGPELFDVLQSSSRDMVDGEKFHMTLAATGAPGGIPSVVKENSYPSAVAGSFCGGILAFMLSASIFVVGTISVRPEGSVAVVAQDAESVGKAVLLDPVFDGPPDFAAMSLPSSVDMVNGQESVGGLSATGAFGGIASVADKNFSSDLTSPLGELLCPFRLSFRGRFGSFLGLEFTPAVFAVRGDPVVRSSAFVKEMACLGFPAHGALLGHKEKLFNSSSVTRRVVILFDSDKVAGFAVVGESIFTRPVLVEVLDVLCLMAPTAPLDLDVFRGYAFFSHRRSFRFKDGLGEKPGLVTANLGFDYCSPLAGWRQAA
jgi:hypothetical protein